MRLSIEISETMPSDGSAEVEIHLDSAGRDRLVAELLALDFPSNDHFHLFSPEWVPGELLTEEKRRTSSLIGRHLKVYIRPNDEKAFSPSND